MLLLGEFLTRKTPSPLRAYFHFNFMCSAFWAACIIFSKAVHKNILVRTTSHGHLHLSRVLLLLALLLLLVLLLLLPLLTLPIVLLVLLLSALLSVIIWVDQGSSPHNKQELKLSNHILSVLIRVAQTNIKKPSAVNFLFAHLPSHLPRRLEFHFRRRGVSCSSCSLLSSLWMNPPVQLD